MIFRKKNYQVVSGFCMPVFQCLLLGARGRRLEIAVRHAVTVNVRSFVRVSPMMCVRAVQASTAGVKAATKKLLTGHATNSAANVST